MKCSVEGCEKPAGSGKSANRRRLCVMHLARLNRHGDVHADFTARAVLRYAVADDGCWIWAGKKQDGYGVVRVGGGRQRAHRWAYEQLVGPIPDGQTLDHSCHNKALAAGRCAPGPCRHRACVNPAHLDVVGRGENARNGAAARTHCKRGHEFTAENTRIRSGKRVCVACRREQGWD